MAVIHPQSDTNWLALLAASRQSGSDPSTHVQRGQDERGLLRVTVSCCQPPTNASPDAPAAADSCAQLLLSAFAESTTSASRSKASQGLLPRGVEVKVLGGGGAVAGEFDTQAGACQPEQQQPQQQAQPLRVQFTATEAAAQGQVLEAACLFEAFWQYHVKAAKSDVHCRMRQRLGGLRQQLLLAKFDGS